MKHLVIVRHAKSSWDHPTLPDIERPLNGRGTADAPVMARRLYDRGIHPQQMITSPARRALATCVAFADVMGFPHDRIWQERGIYHAGTDQLFDVVRSIKVEPGDLRAQAVFLFGHNPGLTDFVNELLDENIDNIPTTGVVSCHLRIERWSDVDVSCGALDFFDYPKRKG